MALKLIRPGQVVEETVLGTTFRLHRWTHGELIDLLRKHTGRGTDGAKASAEAHYRERWIRTLVGWEDLLDADGKPVPFEEGNEDLVWTVASNLPPHVADVLIVRSEAAEVVGSTNGGGSHS